MASQGEQLVALPQDLREQLLRQWLALALVHYPPQTRRFLVEATDPFRNPAGRIYRETLGVVLEELLGLCNWQRIRGALEELIRLRALLGLKPSEAVGFLAELRRLIGCRVPLESAQSSTLDGRVERLLLEAFDLYLECRERMYQARLNEIRRARFLEERLARRQEAT